jgi:hypothetical protein
LQYYEDEIIKGNKDWKGPGPCWCIKDLNEHETCKECQILVSDVMTYQYQRDSSNKGIFANKAQFEEGDIYIQFDKDQQTTCGELNSTQEKLLHTFLNKNKDAFATTVEELNQSDEYQHCIYTEEGPPIALKPYRTSVKEDQYIGEEIQKMLDQQIIRPSQSQWSSPVVLVRKKNGKLRFCVDYRKLNNVTKKDRYPLPRIDELLESLSEASWYTTLDLASGYWQLKVREEDKAKTAFVTKHGLFEFNVMPFGLCNAPATFQRAMDNVLRKIKGKFVLVYLDDIIIFSKNYEEHLQHLQQVFDCLEEANLKINPEKCHFCNKEIQFLGHVINEKGVKPDPAKIEKIVNMTSPRNVRQLRTVLGLFSYYRCFVKNFSKLVAPLNDLLKKDREYEWMIQHQQIFEDVKEIMTTAPILSYPNFNKPFILSTDASTSGLGAVLSQKDEEGKEHPIWFASRTLSPAEKNYNITEQEALAVVWAIKYFRRYLHGSRFLVETDHSALQWLLNQPTKENDNKRIIRWKLMLQEYDFEVKYRKGKANANADTLSRINELREPNTHPNNPTTDINNG